VNLDLESLLATLCPNPTATPSTTQPIVVHERILWLSRAVQSLRQMCARRGLALPAQVTVHVADLTNTQHGPAIGLCWPSTSTGERIAAIAIERTMHDAVDILATLLHELIHAADDCRSQHGPWFAAWAAALGLVGLPSTVPGPALRRELQQIARALGPYPQPQYGFVVYPSGRVQA